MAGFGNLFRSNPPEGGLAGFCDRQEAGRLLGAELSNREEFPDALVLALPRGGVPVGYEVALSLKLPLDVFVVRKLGLPGHEELAIGAIASGGARVWNESLMSRMHLSEATLERVINHELKELERRESLYRGNHPAPELEDRTVILVDDGLATGSSMRAAIHALDQREIRRCVVAVPVAPPHTCDELSELADDVVCLLQPESFTAVGEFYQDFHQTTDDEVRELLAEAADNFHRKAVYEL